MLIKRFISISLFALTLVLVSASWTSAAEPILIFQSSRDGDPEIFAAMDDGTVTQLTNNKGIDKDAAWSPDGMQIVWLTQGPAAGDFDVTIMDANGDNKTNLTPDFATDLASQPTFSPDGTKVSFSARGPIPNGVRNDVVIIELENKLKAWNLTGWGAVDVVPNTNVQDRFAVWSPDSMRIAWWSRREGNYDIYVTDVLDNPKQQAKIQKNLTKDTKETDRNPRFSPDGTKILFESKREGDWELFVMDSDTGKNIVPVTQNEKTERNGSWSRDGKKILFESIRDGNFEIYVIDADGANPVNLTNHKKSDTFPRWSPNGRRIAFVSTRDGNKEIYVMDANGANPVNLSNDLGDDNFPQWRGLGPGAFPSKELAVQPLTKQLTTLGHIKQTALLQNYPNPFNPETWMPYILSKDSSVTIDIYTASGQLVRTLPLGPQKQGAYLFRNQAAYWDGNNDKGEAVGSGIYFYQLRAGDFSTTRKMVIAK